MTALNEHSSRFSRGPAKRGPRLKPLVERHTLEETGCRNEGVPPPIECMPRDEACVATRSSTWRRCRRPARWRRSPSLVPRHLNSFYGFFDERSHRIWLRHVDRVTARYLDDCRTCALG